VSPLEPDRSVHHEIREVLGDRSLRGEALCRALFELGSRRLIEPCRALLLDLAGFDLPEGRARGAVQRIEAHRGVLEAGLGADPGFEVAACDLLHEIEGLLRVPVFRDGPAGAPAGARQEDRPPQTAEEVEREVRRAERTRRPVALMALGPDTGAPADRALLEAALASVREAARDTDLACRAAGDIVLALPCTGAAGALRAADRYRRVLADSTGVAWSAGVVAAGEGGCDAAGLERHAREALGVARARGGARSEPSRADRRAHPRHPAAGAVTGRLVGPDAAAEVVIEDLSLGGALLGSGAPLRPGDEVLLVLKGAAPRTREVLLRSRVGRLADEPEAPAPRRAAVEFPADAAARLGVAALLADLPPAAPTRPMPGGSAA
jgi:hypothetical protein